MDLLFDLSVIWKSKYFFLKYWLLGLNLNMMVSLIFYILCSRYIHITNISPYSVRMRENTEQKNPKYGHFSRSERALVLDTDSFKPKFHMIMYTVQKETADLVTFTEEIRNGKLHFSVQWYLWRIAYSGHIHSNHSGSNYIILLNSSLYRSKNKNCFNNYFWNCVNTEYRTSFSQISLKTAPLQIRENPLKNILIGNSNLVKLQASYFHKINTLSKSFSETFLQNCRTAKGRWFC